MKKLFIFLSISLGLCASAQTFEYERSWGTYYSPANSSMSNTLTSGGIMSAPGGNVRVRSIVYLNNNLSPTYYNQYITPSAQPINMNNSVDVLEGEFTSGGTIVSSSYSVLSGSNYPIYNNKMAYDSAGNSIYIKSSKDPLNDVASAGAWYSSDPNPPSAPVHKILYKNDASGNLLWKTYLPAVSLESHIVLDDADNIYLLDTTTTSSGLATPNTYAPTYESYIPTGGSAPLSNGFVVKLDSNGNRQWATYLPVGGIHDFAYFDGFLYVVTANDVNPAHTQLSTAGSWQQAKANSALIKLDVATGQRTWGTYLGNPSSSSVSSVIHGIQVNAYGIFMAGIHMDFGAGDNYFATPGAHKSQITGSSDLFLTRFSLNGQRVWGTYFGSDSFEQIASNNPIALAGPNIFITGSNLPDGNNIATPGAFKSVKPNNNIGADNLFFAKFDINGNQQWCSYYGGAGSNPSINTVNIGIMTEGLNTLYLYGSTTSPTEIATPDAFQSALSPNISTYTQGFLARFDLIGSMATTESEADTDIILHNNPNNGNFTLTGNALEKEQCNLTVYDAAGRRIYQKTLPRQKQTDISLNGAVSSGNYFVHIKNDKQTTLKVFKMVVKK